MDNKICNEIHCSTPARTRGYCQTHYIRRRRAGEFGGKLCSEPGCNRVMDSKGLCASHYFQEQLGIELRPIQQSGEWGPWEVTGKGYVIRRRTYRGRRSQQWQHRFMMEEHLRRPLLPEENVHHINGNRSDNRLSNLEIWNTKQPQGQRIEDKVQWAKEILAQYEPDALK